MELKWMTPIGEPVKSFAEMNPEELAEAYAEMEVMMTIFDEAERREPIPRQVGAEYWDPAMEILEGRD